MKPPPIIGPCDLDPSMLQGALAAVVLYPATEQGEVSAKIAVPGLTMTQIAAVLHHVMHELELLGMAHEE
ncbi:hypothetical protein WKI65_43490 [Streptomyces sp. MS1.AVA.3]|uniref:hypothetical protein n=1 Tax=Streptomyces decoyicus TaxID=249567 RepID=UPI0030C5E7E5